MHWPSPTDDIRLFGAANDAEWQAGRIITDIVNRISSSLSQREQTASFIEFQPTQFLYTDINMPTALATRVRIHYRRHTSARNI
jgi:hypothetical protein